MKVEEAEKIVERYNKTLKQNGQLPATKELTAALSTLLQTVRDYKEMEKEAWVIRGHDDEWATVQTTAGKWTGPHTEHGDVTHHNSLLEALEAFSEVRGGR